RGNSRGYTEKNRSIRMKKILFISDFDGTISKEDFYKKIMYKYMPEKEETYYKDFKAEKIKDIDFLNEIFTTMNLEEDAIEDEIMQLEIDEGFEKIVEKCRELGIDFVILSAGCEYYIKKIMKKMKLESIPVFSNIGRYEEKGIRINPDQTSIFYSERYGIDKEKVVKHFREQYDMIIYAGDSAPDYKASLWADIRFVKGELIHLYEKTSRSYISIESLEDVISYLDNIKN
ncbi:MtnX-like HAD-IB family phosphatase, partial [Clostridium sp.]|uniref:MtnX-like HAD-IB family phosphatase n=1 Tax=Clostridium sp. TaxID=1506 RepID=UPI003F3B9F71